MLPLSPLTDKVLAFEESRYYRANEAVDWAVEMLEAGHETPSLLILASLSQPADALEATNYLRASCQELGLRSRTGPEATRSLIRYFIGQMALGHRVRLNLENVADLYDESDCEQSLFSFKRLSWAWGDLDYGNLQQEYWPEATKDNIELCVIVAAKQWTAGNFSVVNKF